MSESCTVGYAVIDGLPMVYLRSDKDEEATLRIGLSASAARAVAYALNVFAGHVDLLTKERGRSDDA